MSQQQYSETLWEPRDHPGTLGTRFNSRLERVALRDSERRQNPNNFIPWASRLVAEPEEIYFGPFPSRVCTLWNSERRPLDIPSKLLIRTVPSQ